jgi:hypothetical protein
MAIAFACESCGRRYEVSDAPAGKTGRCKACGQPMRIPAASTVAAPAPEEKEDATESEVPASHPSRAPIGMPARAEEGRKASKDVEPTRPGWWPFAAAGAALAGLGAGVEAIKAAIPGLEVEAE